MVVATIIAALYISLEFIITVGVIIAASNAIRRVWIESGHHVTASKYDLLKLLLKALWKMRSIYLSLFIHIFDFLTDILVLHRWFAIETAHHGHDEHIDTYTTAWTSLGILIFHRVASSLIVYILYNRDIKLALMEFCDVLLFVEIYNSHKKVAHDVETIVLTNSQQNGIEMNLEATESSLRFKHLRSLEALFEATSQAVLQFVFIMRTAAYDEITVISIVFSIISMTNAVINSDNAYMTGDKWKNAKKRFPIPSFEFLKHAFFRLSEIIARVLLYSLFWTVVGGEWFLLLWAIEISFIILYNIYTMFQQLHSWQAFFMSLHFIVVMPPEWIFELSVSPWYWMLSVTGELSGSYAVIIACVCLCGIPLVIPTAAFVISFIISPILAPFFNIAQVYPFSSFRMIVLYIELGIMIWYGNSIDYHNNNYLFSSSHGYYVFIACIVSIVLYSFLYPYLMPDIRLPDHINIRSALGYSYLGNIEELDRQFKRSLNVTCDKYAESTIDSLTTKTEKLENEMKNIESIIKTLKIELKEESDNIYENNITKELKVLTEKEKNNKKTKTRKIAKIWRDYMRNLKDKENNTINDDNDGYNNSHNSNNNNNKNKLNNINAYYKNVNNNKNGNNNKCCLYINICISYIIDFVYYIGCCQCFTCCKWGECGGGDEDEIYANKQVKEINKEYKPQEEEIEKQKKKIEDIIDKIYYCHENLIKCQKILAEIEQQRNELMLNTNYSLQIANLQKNDKNMNLVACYQRAMMANQNGACQWIQKQMEMMQDMKRQNYFVPVIKQDEKEYVD